MLLMKELSLALMAITNLISDSSNSSYIRFRFFQSFWRSICTLRNGNKNLNSLLYCSIISGEMNKCIGQCDLYSKDNPDQGSLLKLWVELISDQLYISRMLLVSIVSWAMPTYHDPLSQDTKSEIDKAVIKAGSSNWSMYTLRVSLSYSILTLCWSESTRSISSLSSIWSKSLTCWFLSFLVSGLSIPPNSSLPAAQTEITLFYA